MSESHWELDLNEAPRDDLDRQPARKKTKVDHDFSTVALTEFDCSSLDQYNSPHYSINDGSINNHGLADSSLFFGSTNCYPEEIVPFSDNLPSIHVDSMVPNETIYDWSSGRAEHRGSTLPGQMIDDFPMDFSQPDFGCLDLIAHDEMLVNNNMDGDNDEDEDKCEDINETLEDGQVVGAERDEFIPEICFGMV